MSTTLFAVIAVLSILRCNVIFGGENYLVPQLTMWLTQREGIVVSQIFTACHEC